MAARLIYPQGTTPDPQRFVVEATLYTEDGRVDRGNRVSIYLGSWEELLPYIHSLYLRVEASPTSPRDEDRDRDRDNYRNRNKGKERERERPHRESSGLEVRLHEIILIALCSRICLGERWASARGTAWGKY